PWQGSAGSQAPADGRQTKAPVTLCTASGGHSALVAVQLSGMSHGPADARQVTDAGWKPSAGQLLLDPSQFSATSHGPAEGRHSAVLLPSAGQAATEPAQFSAVSQPPADG